jgi:hypothetical protein
MRWWKCPGLTSFAIKHGFLFCVDAHRDGKRAFAPTLPANWRVVGVADFNRDGEADYLLYNASTRQTAIWYLSGSTLISGAYGPMIASGYTLIGAADFNADGKPDYVLYGPSVQGTILWYLDNNVFTGSANGPTLPAGWSLTQR